MGEQEAVLMEQNVQMERLELAELTGESARVFVQSVV